MTFLRGVVMSCVGYCNNERYQKPHVAPNVMTHTYRIDFFFFSFSCRNPVDHGTGAHVGPRPIPMENHISPLRRNHRHSRGRNPTCRLHPRHRLLRLLLQMRRYVYETKKGESTNNNKKDSCISEEKSFGQAEC